MAEEMMIDGKKYIKYKNGHLIPEESYKKSLAQLTSMMPQEKAKKLALKKLTISEVKKHIDKYINSGYVMESPCNEKTLEKLGMAKGTTWRQVLWNVCTAEVVENHSMLAVSILIKLDDNEARKKHMIWQEKFEEREQKLRISKSRIINTDIVENNFGDTGV